MFNEKKNNMTKMKFLIAGLISMIFASSCKSQSVEQSQIVTEVAIYRIAKEKNGIFEDLLTKFRMQVGELKGFQDYLTLQNIGEDNIYIDILHWDNINLALAASENVKTGKRYKPFTSAIDSLIVYGEFYQFKNFNHKNVNTMKNKISEVVVYKIKEDKISDYANIAEITNAFLSKQKGFNSREILQDFKEKDTFMDIVIWDSMEDAQNAMQVSQKDASLMPFFEATEKIVTFSHYNHYK